MEAGRRGYSVIGNENLKVLPNANTPVQDFAAEHGLCLKTASNQLSKRN